MSKVHNTIAEFSRLNSELDEMARPVDEEIMLHQIAIKELEEKKKDAFKNLMNDIDKLAKEAKSEVELFGESIKIAHWNFVVSNGIKVNQKQLKIDAMEDESLQKYLSETTSVSIRRS